MLSLESLVFVVVVVFFWGGGYFLLSTFGFDGKFVDFVRFVKVQFVGLV